MRESQISRKTAETDISLQLVIEGSGSYDVRSGSYFFDHMLEQVARHGSFDLYLRCSGDVEVDFHHSVEDVGICLGEAFRDALGDKRGIRRYGSIILPMDESLALCALDFSGRTHLNFDVQFPPEYKVGDLDTSSSRNFSRRSRGPLMPPCTSNCFAARMCTTSRRRCSRRLRAHSRKRAPLKAAARTDCPARRGCYDCRR